MTFANTEYAFTYSGGTWLQANTLHSEFTLVSGSLNVASGRAILHGFAGLTSGLSDRASFSGVECVVTLGTSGMYAILSGRPVFTFRAGAHSGLGTGNLGITPVPPQFDLGLHTLSGINVGISGILNVGVWWSRAIA